MALHSPQTKAGPKPVMTKQDDHHQLGDIRFAQVFLGSGVAMMIIQQNGKVVFSTVAAARIFGLEATQISGWDIEDLLPETTVTSLLTIVEPPTNDATVRGIIGRHVSGRSITLSIHSTQSRDDKNQKIITLVLRDISGELQIERILLEDLRLSDSAVVGARIGTFEYHVMSAEVKVSRVWRELMEIPTGNSTEVQQEWHGRVHPEDIEAALAPVNDCLDK